MSAAVTVRPRAAPHARRTLVDRIDATFGHWSLAPAVALLVALTVVPMLDLLALAVSSVEFVDGRAVWHFASRRNLDALLSDPALGATALNTAVFVAVAVALEMLLGLGLALLVARLSRGKGLARTVMILPILVPPVAVGSVWKLLYNYDFGVLNAALGALHIAPVNWLGSTHVALLAVIAVDVWHWVPFVFLILFAAVEGVPPELVEAARIDGATPRQITWRVIVPLLRPALAVAFLFRAIFAFKAFDEVFLLTGGGPGTSTELVSLHLYEVYFRQNDLGYGALLSLAIIATIVGVLLVARRARIAFAGP